MRKNVGNTDRVVRLIVAAIFGYLVFNGTVDMGSLIGIIMTVVSIIFAFTGLVGWCAVYQLFGASTCPAKT